ncbi:MAG TPA: hypothetical protein VMB26_09785 [Candidatus Binataceae bacterium]|nr:hypothetical protein [Candidatus Binataceae bacterium]
MKGIHAHPSRKLGRKPYRHDPRNLQFAKYLIPEKLPAPQPHTDWSGKVRNPIGMHLNDTIGDCTCAAVANAIELVSANTGNQVSIPDAQVLQMYEVIGGYVPGNPSTDNGALISDALKYWQKSGLKDSVGANHKLGAYLQIDPANLAHRELAVQLFGWVNLGIALPATAQNQDLLWQCADSLASSDGAPGSWGGHSVIQNDYSPTGRGVMTWNIKLWGMSVNFDRDYVDEAWTGISEDWVHNIGLAPSGFDMQQLLADLQALK